MEAYENLQDLSCGMRVKGLREKEFPEIARVLKQQIEQVANKLAELDLSTWEQTFVANCNKLEKTLSSKWKTDYLSLANGKLIFESLQKKYLVSQSQIRIKLMLMDESAKANTTEWKELNQLLSSNLK